MKLLNSAGLAAVLVAASATTYSVLAQTHDRSAPSMEQGNGFTRSQQSALPFLSSTRTNHSSLIKRKVASGQLSAIKAQQHGDIPEIYGSVVYSENPALSTPGIYRLPTGAGESFRLTAAGPNATFGGTMVADTYYTAYMGGSSFMQIPTIASWDSTTWLKKGSTGCDNSCLATDVTYDAVTGKIFGCFSNASGTSMILGTIDYSIGLVNRIAATTDQWCAIAAAPDGTLFGITTDYAAGSATPTGSTLYTINKNNGTKTKVGTTGLVPHKSYTTSAVIDPRSGRMFWAFYNDASSGLYEIDTTSGQASLVVSYPMLEQITGLYIVSPAAEDGAPAECENLTASFPLGQLNGNVQFTLPSKLFDGTPISGSVSYKLSDGTNIISSGNGAAGTVIIEPVTVPKAGKYTFTATAYNAVGDSPAAKVDVFIGHGSPAVPEVTASYSEGYFHVQWSPVTESTDGGYLDPAAVTYKVVRYPSNTVVETATKATSVDIEFEEPSTLTQYHYGVTASYNGKSSKEGLSNTLTLGSIVPPYTHAFDSKEKAANHTIINANNDHRQWVYNTGAMVMQWNKEMAMDDWLITPPVKLQRGYSYKFTVNANIQSSSSPEKMDVKCGTAPTAEAMTMTIIQPTTLTNAGSDMPFSGTIIPPADGVYYIGIHGISDPDMYNLYVSGYTIDAPASAAGPAAPEALTLTPDPNGAYRVKVSVTAPVTDLVGERLTALTRLDILRNGTLIKSYDNPQPGETFTFYDEMGAGGETAYTAVAYNAYGKGDDITAYVLVGINPPAAPSDVTLIETGTPGEVTLSWSAVDKDASGNPLNSDLVTYTIYQLQAETHVVIFDNIAGTSHTFRAVNPGEQNFVHFFVSAQTDGGISPVVDSPLIPAGTPFPLPYNEKFPNGDTSNLMAFDDAGTVMWSLITDNNSYGVASHSADNGMLLSKGRATGDTGLIHTMKIMVDENTVKPGASFYLYNMGDGYGNKAELMVFADGKWASVASNGDSGPNTQSGWQMVSGSLENYIGKEVLIGIRTTAVTHMETIVDDLYVGTTSEHDIAVTDICAPVSAGYNKPFSISATVRNKGVNPASEYTVVLMADNLPVESIAGHSLAPGASETYTFGYCYGPKTDTSVKFRIKADMESDELPDDNISDEVTVDLSVPELPTVSDLKGYRSERGIELQWSEPATDGYHGEPATEDFEQYAQSATEFGEWQTFDGDAKPIGQITDVEIPGIGFGSRQSWWVMDASDESLNGSFAANSGNKYISQMYLSDGSQCDD